MNYSFTEKKNINIADKVHTTEKTAAIRQPQTILEQQTLCFIRQNRLLVPGTRVLIAVSGGADSICLLRILKNLERILDIHVEAVTVNHGIRGVTAERDVEFVRSQCGKWEVPVHVCQVDVPEMVRRESLSEEEAARKARYDCFFQVAQEIGADKIAVAHHRDDNCETILHNLFRGSSLRGIGGMAPSRTMENYEQKLEIIRPFLFVSRKELENWLMEQEISWCTDETNLEDDYTRNRLRHQVIPLVEREINSRASEHVVQAGGYLAEAQELVEELAKQWMEAYGSRNDSGIKRKESQSKKLESKDIESKDIENKDIEYRISISALKKCRPIVIREIFMQACRQVKGEEALKDMGRVHLETLMKLVEGETSKWTVLPGNIRVKKQYDQLIFYGCGICNGTSEEKQYRQKQKKSDVIPAAESETQITLSDGKIIKISQPGLEKEIFFRIFSYNNEKIPENNYTKWFDYDRIKNGLSLRTRQPGDYFLLESGGRKTVKSYMIDQKIPLEQRNQIPLLAEDSHVLWIGDGRISAAYKVNRDTHNVLEIILKRGE